MVTSRDPQKMDPAESIFAASKPTVTGPTATLAKAETQEAALSATKVSADSGAEADAEAPGLLFKLLMLLRNVLFGTSGDAGQVASASIAGSPAEKSAAKPLFQDDEATLPQDASEGAKSVSQSDKLFSKSDGKNPPDKKDAPPQDQAAENKVIDTTSPKDLPDSGYPFAAGDPLGFAPDADPDNNRDFFQTGAGDDLIRTGDDRDTVLAGAGDDQVDGGFDDDEIDGGAGNDRLVGGEGADTLLGGGGDDLIFAGNDPARVPDAFNIEDVAGPGNSPFAPDRNPENGRDFVDGGAGNDAIYGADDRDTLLGGSGDDTIDGEIDDDLIFGSTGDDLLLGGQGADTIFGGAGRDTFAAASAGDILDGGSGAEDFDTLDLRGSAAAGETMRLRYTSEDREDGFVQYFDGSGEETGRLTFTEMESVISCFTIGTRIATPRGERLVEDLRVGDEVITRDNGMQRIRWVGKRHVTPAGFAQHPEFQPIRIPKGALGKGLPLRALTVSPNHRVLISGQRTALYFEENEVLVAAKHLVGHRGIRRLAVSDAIYLHIMCDRHEVILSEGAWTESFQPGDLSLGGVDGAQRRELFALFPALKTPDGVHGYAAARRSLKKHEAKLLLESV